MARERVIHFGAAGNLVGILSGPEQVRSEAPVFLMWNVGLNHRVGPFRIFVDLARELASAGFLSLRFDLSGLGDSEVANSDVRLDGERAPGDIRAAMETLREQGHEQFVLVGFCSSVDAAHQLTLEDNRAVGAVFIEGYAFKNAGYKLRYPLRFLNRHRWERKLRVLRPEAYGLAKGWADAVSVQEQVYKRVYPSAEKFGADVRTMARRGAQLLFLYVGGESSYSYRDQIFEDTGRGDFESHIDVEFYPDSDHTFFQPTHRARAIQRVVNWATMHFGASRTGSLAASDGTHHSTFSRTGGA